MTTVVHGEPKNPLLGLVPEQQATVPTLLEVRAERTPENVFLRWEGRTWTYSEAWVESARFAAWLLKEAHAPACVTSFLSNRPETLWTWFGTLIAGATYVPINRAHRGEVLADMLFRSEASVLATDREGIMDLPDLAGSAISRLMVVDGGDGDSSWSAVESLDPARRISRKPADLAELMYTSGTTGRSKCVRLSHNQICRGAGWVAWSLGIGPEDVFHAWLPLFHIAGQSDTVMPAVIAGASVALYPTFSRSRFWDEVAESGATLFIGFSNVAHLLNTLAPRDDDAEVTLRAGVTGAVSATLRTEFESRFNAVLHDVYGMTEAEPMILPPPGISTPPGSCGCPSPDFEVAVLDRGGRILPAGEVGEIVCRPRVPNVLTSGYEGDPEATLANRADLWFHTGDLGRSDADGFFYFVDRIKHSIRRRGENVSSWEIENTVVKHPVVVECSAIGVPSPLGEEDVKVTVVLESGCSLDPEDLWGWCQERMAAFMVPRYIEVVDALPRADTGKVMKEQLSRLGTGVWDAGEGKRFRTLKTDKDTS